MIDEVYKQRNSEQGFTLLELVIVISVLTVLIGIIVINVRPTSDKTIALQIKGEAQDVYDIAEVYRLSTGVVKQNVLENNLKPVLDDRYSKYTSDPKYYTIDRRRDPTTDPADNIYIYKIALSAKIDENLRITSEFEVMENSKLLLTCRGNQERSEDLINSGVCDVWKSN